MRVVALFAIAVLGIAIAAAAVAGAPLLVSVAVLVVMSLLWALFAILLCGAREAGHLLSYEWVRGLCGHYRERAWPSGARRTIPRPRRNADAPTLAWSHDGWTHADGHLLGLDLLDSKWQVTAFGWEPRFRGDPTVTVELLPGIRRGPGLRLLGLERRLRAFDAVWAGGSYEGTTWQALEARARGGPFVVSFEVESVVANYGCVSHPLRERAIREVDHFCVTSTIAASVLELDGVEPERMSLVPMPVDAPALSPQELAALRSEGRRRWQLEEADVVALFIGRGVWEKGLHTVAGAAARLGRVPGSRVRWLVAGEGEYFARFRQIIEHYEVTDAVRVVGWLGDRDRHLCYASADVLVVPSNPTPHVLEQFGRVIPEALHFGLPVVGSASGAIPEVIGDAGTIVAPADHLGLATAVDAMTDAAYRRSLGERARRRAIDYSVVSYVDRVSAALESGRERHDRVFQSRLTGAAR